MANMSYCRFRNTLNDLNDCVDALQEGEELSEDELIAMKLMKEVAEQFVELAEEVIEEEEE